MSHHTLLKAFVAARLRLTSPRPPARTGTRAGDSGQTAFEYLGIILVVVVIIGAIVGLGIGTAITNRIAQAVESITAG
ncbi:hypothetical protein [Streptomyces sp. NPDC051567]|uniref:hypothetical protein n=1 Tax=Streptomyces sp. NPDC051567 TaxID=3365660 RepID=UPI00378FB2D1